MNNPESSPIITACYYGGRFRVIHPTWEVHLLSTGGLVTTTVTCLCQHTHGGTLRITEIGLVSGNTKSGRLNNPESSPIITGGLITTTVRCLYQQTHHSTLRITENKILTRAADSSTNAHKKQCIRDGDLFVVHQLFTW